MTYNKGVYAAALKRLEERRQAAEAENAELRRHLYHRLPRLQEIEKELALTGISAAKEILAGGADTAKRIEELKKANLELQAERAELLTLSGFAPEILLLNYECEKCSDTGFVGDKACDCLKKLLKEEACKRANSGTPLPLFSFDDFNLLYYPETKLDDSGLTARRHMTRVYDYCRKYSESFEPQKSRSLIFLGQTGLGKTHLALSIANAVINSGFTVIYDTAQNIFMKMEDEFFGRSERAEKRYTTSVFDCDLLVIDDLGAEFASAFNNSTLYNIINTRMLAGRPVIVSANITETELLARYSERIFSRFIGDYTLLKFFGSDIRQIKLRENNP